MSDDDPILTVSNLTKEFRPTATILDAVRESLLGDPSRRVRALDDVDLVLNRNQVQGVIGESGCGKSTLLRTLIGLHSPTEGTIEYRGEDVSEFSSAEMKAYRRDVQIVFQDPFEALNPKMTVRAALEEPFSIHGVEPDPARLDSVLERVQLDPPEKYLDRRPAQLSGGEKQRVALARALVLDPKIILADEPFSMLDVSTQASVLRLMEELTDDLDLSIIYVSHDISTVSYICDELNVMYLGRVVERGETSEILEHAAHPYTQALIRAVPIPDPHHQRESTELAGSPPDPSDIPSGCRFKDRCPERMDVCDQTPASRRIDEATNHWTACHLYEETEHDSPVAATATDGEGN